MSSHSLALQQSTIEAELRSELISDKFATDDPFDDNVGHRYRLIKRIYARDGKNDVLVAYRFIWGGRNQKDIDRMLLSYSTVPLPWWNNEMQGAGLKAMISFEERVAKRVEPGFVDGEWRKGYWLKVWEEREVPR